ncbi:MAG: hypothetical protein HOO96_35315 [Polyangiaceae bacterium]|nr:hypothetical protein [Polyangiaceae bacterium]
MHMAPRNLLAVATWSLLAACSRSSAEGSHRPTTEASAPIAAPMSAADAAVASVDASTDAGGSFARLRGGKLIARGVWGVHNTGNLRVRIDAEECVATYNAEGSYFCGSTHKLDCKLEEDGRAAVVTERSCVVHCTNGRGCADGSSTCTLPCYAANAGIHGTLRRSPEGEAFFYLDPKVVESRKRWSRVDRLPTRDEPN